MMMVEQHTAMTTLQDKHHPHKNNNDATLRISLHQHQHNASRMSSTVVVVVPLVGVAAVVDAVVVNAQLLSLMMKNPL